MILGLFTGTSWLKAASLSANRPNTAVDYEEPKRLIGLIVAPGDSSRKLLFKSQRTSTRSGSTVRVMCEYTDPKSGNKWKDLDAITLFEWK